MRRQRGQSAGNSTDQRKSAAPSTFITRTPRNESIGTAGSVVAAATNTASARNICFNLQRSQSARPCSVRARRVVGARLRHVLTFQDDRSYYLCRGPTETE